MIKKRILAVPALCFWAVIAVCLTGIVIGSFLDFDIGMAVANKTTLGTYFATFSPFLAYALYPAGGACLFVGLKKKGAKPEPGCEIIVPSKKRKTPLHLADFLGVGTTLASLATLVIALTKL